MKSAWRRVLACTSALILVTLPLVVAHEAVATESATLTNWWGARDAAGATVRGSTLANWWGDHAAAVRRRHMLAVVDGNDTDDADETETPGADPDDAAAQIDSDLGESRDSDIPCGAAVLQPYKQRRIIMSPKEIRADKILNSIVIHRAKTRALPRCKLQGLPRIVIACVERNQSSTDKRDYGTFDEEASLSTKMISKTHFNLSSCLILYRIRCICTLQVPHRSQGSHSLPGDPGRLRHGGEVSRTSKAGCYIVFLS